MGESVFHMTWKIGTQGKNREGHSNCQAGGRKWRIKLLILWAKPPSLSEVQSWGSGNIKGMGLVSTVCSGWPWVHSLTTLTSVPLCVHLSWFPLWYREGIVYKEILWQPLAQGTLEAMLVPFMLYWVPWYASPPQLEELSPLLPTYHQKLSDMAFWKVCKASGLTVLSYYPIQLTISAQGRSFSLLPSLRQ